MAIKNARYVVELDGDSAVFYSLREARLAAKQHMAKGEKVVLFKQWTEAKNSFLKQKSMTIGVTI